MVVDITIRKSPVLCLEPYHVENDLFGPLDLGLRSAHWSARSY
jgi:hypothetical protein